MIQWPYNHHCRVVRVGECVGIPLSTTADTAILDAGSSTSAALWLPPLPPGSMPIIIAKSPSVTAQRTSLAHELASDSSMTSVTSRKSTGGHWSATPVPRRLLLIH